MNPLLTRRPGRAVALVMAAGLLACNTGFSGKFRGTLAITGTCGDGGNNDGTVGCELEITQDKALLTLSANVSCFPASVLCSIEAGLVTDNTADVMDGGCYPDAVGTHAGAVMTGGTLSVSGDTLDVAWQDQWTYINEANLNEPLECADVERGTLQRE